MLKMKMIGHCGSIIRDMIKVYVSLLPTHRYPLHIFLLMIFAISVSSQQIHLPAERFKCGPDVLNLSCERWGYDACITDGGDSYCMPCNEEYLASLCGTQEEITGCNLYCTQMVVDEEVRRAKVNFTEQLEYIAQQRYSSNIHENKALVQRMNTLKQSLRNKDIAIIAISVALGIAMVILIIVVSCYICKKHNRRTRIYDEERPEGDDRSSSASLMKNDAYDNATNVSDETKLKEFDVKPDSIEDLHKGYNVYQAVTTTACDTDQQSATTSEGNIQQEDAVSSDGGSSNIGLSGTSQAQEMEHSSGRYLSNIHVPATNTKGCDKLAIKRNDVSHQQASS